MFNTYNNSRDPLKVVLSYQSLLKGLPKIVLPEYTRIFHEMILPSDHDHYETARFYRDQLLQEYAPIVGAACIWAMSVRAYLDLKVC